MLGGYYKRKNPRGGVRIFREKYLKPHFGNVSWEGKL